MKAEPIYKDNDTALKALVESLRGMGDVVRYSDMHYLGDCKWEDLTKPKDHIAWYGKWARTAGDVVPFDWDHLFVPNYLTYSDYSGGTCERANTECFLEEHKDVEGVYEVIGGYGTRGVAVLLSAIDEEMMDTFLALQNYPVIDDEAISKLEMELEDEDWKDWIEHDLRRALHRKFDQEDEDGNSETCMPEVIDEISDEKLFNIYRELCERTNTNWFAESAIGGHVDIDRLVAGCTMDDLLGKEEEGL